MVERVRVAVVEYFRQNDGDYAEVLRGYESAEKRKPGYEIEILRLVMQLARLDFEFVRPPAASNENNHGYLNETTGQWSGLMGMLQRGEIDVGASIMRDDAARRQDVVFSYPIFYAQQLFILAKPKTHHLNQFILRPFRRDVWFAFAVTLLLAVLVQWVIGATVRLRGRRVKHRLLHGQHVLWNFLAILMRQHEQEDRYAAAATLAKFWGFFCLILVTYYQSVMTGLLSVTLRPKLPFNSFDGLIDLLDEGKMHLSHTDARQLPGGTPRQKERLQETLQNNPLVVHPNTYEMAMDIIFNGGVNYGVYDINVLASDAAEFLMPQLMQVRDKGTSYWQMGYILPKNSTIKQRIDDAIIKILPGVDRIQMSYEQSQPFPPYGESVDLRETPLSFEHLLELFTLYALCLGVSITVFVIEQWGWRRARRREMRDMRRSAMTFMFAAQAHLGGLLTTHTSTGAITVERGEKKTARQRALSWLDPSPASFGGHRPLEYQRSV